jgi:Malic enzyme, N-terminal domain
VPEFLAATMIEATGPASELVTNACASVSPISNLGNIERHVTVHSALEEMRAISTPLERYMYIRGLKQRTPDVFYALLYMHVQEVLPYVYTPTVGEACEKYHALGIKTWGLYLSYEDKGHLFHKMRQFTKELIKVIVVTDGERILGLGDLGTGGMVCSSCSGWGARTLRFMLNKIRLLQH